MGSRHSTVRALIAWHRAEAAFLQRLGDPRGPAELARTLRRVACSTELGRSALRSSGDGRRSRSQKRSARSEAVTARRIGRMPIYEFECEECGSRFDELVAADASAAALPALRRGAGPAPDLERRAARPPAARAPGSAPTNRAAASAKPATRSGSRGTWPSGRRGSSRERHGGGAARGAGRALQGGPGLHALPAARDPHQGGLRRRQRRRRPDVRRRGAGRRRGPPGPALRRPRRPAAQPDAGGDRPLARGRLHRQRAQVEAARQPRPAAARDRGLPALPLRAGAPDRAAGRLHARQLRDQAAERQPGGDHQGPRHAPGPRARRARRLPAAALPPGRGAAHAGGQGDPARRLRDDPRRCSPGRRRRRARAPRRSPSSRRRAARPRRRPPTSSTCSAERRGAARAAARRPRPKRSARGSRPASSPARSSSSPATSAPARRPWSAAPAGRSGSRSRSPRRPSRSASATAATGVMGLPPRPLPPRRPRGRGPGAARRLPRRRTRSPSSSGRRRPPGGCGARRSRCGCATAAATAAKSSSIPHPAAPRRVRSRAV